MAFGAIFLLSALVGGILAATGVETTVGDEAREATLGAGIAVVATMFLAYLWGGYTAGRMGRGAGAVHGLLVPMLALIVAAVVVGVVAVLGATANLNLPFGDFRLPIDEGDLVEFGVGVGVASLIAMFLGGILGGMTGARWHTKLERHAVDAGRESLAVEERERAEVRRADEERLAESRARAEERREAQAELRERSTPPAPESPRAEERPRTVDLREEETARRKG
ncbi:MAG TPA: hypothetical protein VE549_04070 [Myxococcaceae bacterium]|nr:hypothetical protein [Myxococcaceae bacterium]